MNVTKQTIQELDSFLKEHLEADVVALIAQRLDVASDKALAIYFSSALPEKIENGEHGIQYLSAEYLADEVIREQNLEH